MSPAVSSLVVVVLLLAGCTSQSSTARDPVAAESTETETPVAETPAASTNPTATAVPTPEPDQLSDTEMIALARTTFDANAQPGELIAWDHLDAEAFGDTVRLEICSWTGKTVFDDLRTVEYQIEPDGTASDIFDSSLLGDCLNTELIDTALAFTRDYDAHWQAVLHDPSTFDPAEAAFFKTAERVNDNKIAVEGWVRDGLHWEGPVLDGQLPDSAVRDLLGRSFTVADIELFELIACRDMDERYGLYQGDVLIDDSRGDRPGSNSIVKYQLSRQAGRWELAGRFTNVWADCVDPNRWLGWVDEWQPEAPTHWEVVVENG